MVDRERRLYCTHTRTSIREEWMERGRSISRIGPNKKVFGFFPPSKKEREREKKDFSLSFFAEIRRKLFALLFSLLPKGIGEIFVLTFFIKLPSEEESKEWRFEIRFLAPLCISDSPPPSAGVYARP